MTDNVRLVVDGRRVWFKGYTDLRATQQLAAKKELELAQGEVGLQDKFKAHKSRRLVDHVADYVTGLAVLKKDDKYIYVVTKRLEPLVKECGWESTRDITADSFSRWRDGRQKTAYGQGRRKTLGAGASPRTLDQWLECIRGFCNWMIEHKRMKQNPLAEVKKINGEPIRQRRAFTDAEVDSLLDKSAPDRRTVWETLLLTALRVQEAADLEWRDCHLDGIRPRLTLRAGKTKSRKIQSVPLRVDHARQLQNLRQDDAKDTDRVFTAFPTFDDWKVDLAAAGISYFDGQDRQVDRHALRHTFGTRFATGGCA